MTAPRRARSTVTVMIIALATSLVAMPAAAHLAGSDAEAASADDPWLERRVLNIGHRGSGFEAPENTLFGLQTGVDNGAHMLEFDLVGTADGEVVAIHDTTVDRTTDGSGEVADKTLAELKELDAAYWFVGGSFVDRDADEEDYLLRGIATGDRPAPPGTEPNDFRVPTLEEILTRFPTMPMILEIKQLRDLPDDTIEAEICRLLEEFDRGDETILAGFEDDDIERVARCAPEAVSTSPGTAEAATFFATSRTGQPLPGSFLRHDVLFLPYEFNGIRPVDESTVAAAHGNDLAIHVFTVNGLDEQRELLDLGVDGIVNDIVTATDERLEDRGVRFDPPRACPAGTRAAGLTDRDTIPTVHRGAVDCAVERGIVLGRQDGTFGPLQPIRRDQLASVVARAIEATAGAPDLPSGDRARDRFDDLDGNVHAEAIAQLVEAGVLLGRTESRFDPSAATRRDQLASVLVRATAFVMGRDEGAFAGDAGRFHDVDPRSVHARAIGGAADLGLVRGRVDGTFAPDEPVRRDQLASVVDRLVGGIERGTIR